MKAYFNNRGGRENKEQSAAVIRNRKGKKLASNTAFINKAFYYFHF